MSPPAGRALGSTYRLQVQGLGLDAACQLVAYLARLGVETLYLSPLTQAVAGSPHGYNVVDPTRVDPALGGPDALGRLLDELGRHGMRLLVDAVPNHMAVDPADRWWWDVLARGRESASAPVFSIDWESGGGRVLLATLEAPLADLLLSGRIGVVDGELSAAGQRFPLAPGSERCPEDPAVVLEHQHYRLGYWRLQRYESNYRRFLDVDTLIGVRVEDPAVYERTHALLLALGADERVAGLRIDHVDGLADPTGYLCRLRADLEARRAEPPVLVVEKILGPGEWLRRDWPVEGTTGYEFADLATRLFVDRQGAAAIGRLGAAWTGDDRGFDELAVAGRRFVLDQLFTGQLDRLAELAVAALEEAQPGNDLARVPVRAALSALVAHLDVYRSYLWAGGASPADRARLVGAARAASAELRGEDARALSALSALLAERPVAQDGPVHDLAVRFQQVCGAVAAKGVEDTACYRWSGLLVSAEVGGQPAVPAVGPDELHAALGLRARRSPGGLNALSTHDTKRSADVRARLAALSEVAAEWERSVERWRRRTRRVVEDNGGPDEHDQLFCYQSLFGIWPWPGDPGGERAALRERLGATMAKAAREAKRATSWLDPDEAYERALSAFVEVTVSDQVIGRDLDRLVRRIGPAAATNALAMTTLAATAPGVPDLYQGSEAWQLALVDPDNRRPVDFAPLREWLDALPVGEPSPATATALLRSWPDGRLKLWVTASLLGVRRERPALFASRSYLPLEVRGTRSNRVLAFARRRGREWAVTVVPRLPLSVAGPGRFALGEVWGRTRVVLPDGAPAGFVDRLTGVEVVVHRGALAVAEVLGALPVAALTEST